MQNLDLDIKIIRETIHRAKDGNSFVKELVNYKVEENKPETDILLFDELVRLIRNDVLLALRLLLEKPNNRNAKSSICLEMLVLRSNFEKETEANYLKEIGIIRDRPEWSKLKHLVNSDRVTHANRQRLVAKQISSSCYDVEKIINKIEAVFCDQLHSQLTNSCWKPAINSHYFHLLNILENGGIITRNEI